jgi:hypothetical protein
MEMVLASDKPVKYRVEKGDGTTAPALDVGATSISTVSREEMDDR